MTLTAKEWRMATKWILWLGIVVLLTWQVCLYCFGRTRYGRSLLASTKMQLSEMNIRLEVILRRHPNVLEGINKSSKGVSVEINKAVARLLRMEGAPFRLQSINRNGLLSDSYGNALMFSITHENGNSKPLSLRLRVWSCGPNGIDETGNGDDI